jgi:hypothetical protein
MQLVEIILSALFPPRLPKWQQPVVIRQRGDELFESEVASAIGRPRVKLYADALDRHEWHRTYQEIT